MTSTSGVQEYLEAMFRLTAGTTDTPVSTSALANEMSISAASVSEMLRRLSSLGLVDHRPYVGATLTATGLTQAAAVVRYHRLWERFLTDILGMAWDEVHSEACRLEHATSPAVAERLDAFLQRPTTCPHGNEVPAGDGQEERCAASDACDEDGASLVLIALESTRDGFRGMIGRVDEHPELLQYCAKSGLVPGATVHVVASDSFEGSRRVEVWPPEAGPAQEHRKGTMAAGGAAKMPPMVVMVGPRAAGGVYVAVQDSEGEGSR